MTSAIDTERAYTTYTRTIARDPNNKQNMKKFCNAFSLLNFFGIYYKYFFILRMLKYFCTTIQCAKFQHKSPDKIIRYS
jgi:hypothetical protein